MKERIIAATGIYRECRCNRRSRDRTETGREEDAVTRYSGCDRCTDRGGGMHLGTCYLLPRAA